MARKRGMQFIPYDYEAAYNKAMEDMHEWFIENLFQHRKKVIYALKEITAGDQFEIEIYPQFRSMDEVPPEGRTIKKDNNKAQKNLNDKNARKYVERLINENFSDRDIWMTLTYDDEHLPPDGDVDAAIKNVQKYIRRINYQRKKRGLPNAKYVYVTAYNPDAEIRWHHHIVMDGALDMETVESCWKQSSRNEVRRLQTDENGLSGMANYIVEEKNRVPSEKRWNSSQGLRDPRIKVVHSKRPAAGGSYKKIEKEFTANETAIGKTETALANQTVKTEKSKTALMNMEAELKNVNDQLKDNKLEKFATACDTAGTKMESFGKKMSVVSAGIAGIGAASIKAFTELDEGYDTIVTKTGATGEALEGLTKSADNVFGTMPEDMSTVGEAIGEVNTRFHTTGTELEKTSKQFIQFATINGTNVTQSVGSTGQAKRNRSFTMTNIIIRMTNLRKECRW